MKEEKQNGRHPQFERRSVELAQRFGQAVETFSDLPECYREFCEIVGYSRVCSMLVLYVFHKGMSIRRIAMRYDLTEKAVRVIKDNGKKIRR